MKRFASLVSIVALVVLGVLFSLPYSTMAGKADFSDRFTRPDDMIVVARSLKDLIKHSDIIVIGQITNTNTWINLARDNDLRTPHKFWLTVGQVYRVNVERYLMGSGSNVIYFAQGEGTVTFGQTQTPNAIETARAYARTTDHYKIPRSNTSYMLFLSQLCFLQDHFVGAITPWRFDLSDPDHVMPESTWEGAIEHFPPKPLPAFIRQVQELIPRATPTVEPPPLGTGIMQPANSSCAEPSGPVMVTVTPEPVTTTTPQPSR